MVEVELIKDLIAKTHDHGGKLLYFALSGSDLYGFNSKDSDKDYRGAYIIRTNKLHGLATPDDVINYTEGLNDVVLFEMKKEINLMMKSNCNVLEHIFAPPIYTSPEHQKLKELTLECISADGVYNSYRGMAYENYNKFIKVGKAGVKKYLYVIRALLAGIHTLRTGSIEPNIIYLNRNYKSKEIDQLIQIKKNGLEKDELKEPDPKLDKIIDDLFSDINDAFTKTKLPHSPDKDTYKKVDLFLKKLRRENMD